MRPQAAAKLPGEKAAEILRQLVAETGVGAEWPQTVANFWKSEEEMEKMLEGLAQ